MDLKLETKTLLTEMGAGTTITSSAYDTAWIARLQTFDQEMASKALEWLRENQLPDGSWGSYHPLYFHDRVICTLSAIIALETYGTHGDRSLIERGLLAFEQMWQGLGSDISGETIAFEMILPTLLSETRRLKLSFAIETQRLQKYTQIRAYKLSKSPEKIINRYVTMAHSAEMVGTDGLHLLDLDNLQEPNGSVGHSPAATAFLTLNSAHTPLALSYLQEIMKPGSVPPVNPIDVFERGWILWNFALTNDFIDDELLELIQPHLSFLDEFWDPHEGIGFASGYEPRDADETGIVQSVFTHFDCHKSIESILYYEEGSYYRCFELEANPSVSANIHVLDALIRAGMDPTEPSVQKVIAFLSNEQNLKGFWSDKWHISPYYTTSHAMIVLSSLSHPSLQAAIVWVLATQSKEGAWGFHMPTAEETAYCLLALVICRKRGYPIPEKVIKKGYQWLIDHHLPPYPPLWIGKCLYAPIHVIRSTILSALILVESL